MKRIHKAIKYLSLALLVSSIAMTIRAEGVTPDTGAAEETAAPVEKAQTVTPAVIVGLVAQAVTVETAPVEVKVVEISHVEEVIKIFKPFFTDKNYVVKKSFKKMCLEAVTILRKSTDTGLHKVADFLEKICNKNILGIALDLKNNKAILTPLAPQGAETQLKETELMKRLAAAVAFKDK